jgi:D-serine deaminase-like pyridoxal phosphate-dependent protein
LAAVKACCNDKQQEIEQLKLKLAKAEKTNKLLRKKAITCYELHSPATPEVKAHKRAMRDRAAAKAKAKAKVKPPKSQA